MADAAQPTESPKKEIFCTAQQLSLLTVRTDVRPYLSGERFWQERDDALRGGKARSSPWEPVDRWKLARRLTAGGDVKRLAVVCAAGLGKSTNLKWLEKELAAPKLRQVPFLFELDDEDLPRKLDDFWHVTLPDEIPCVPGNGGVTKQRILYALSRYRAQGRITLLLDSIDQATPSSRQLVRALLKSGEWDNCPIVISARPHALFERWNRIIGRNEAKWHFVQIEALEAEQRQLLLNQEGIDRYGRLPPGGQALMANPRNIEYVRELPPYGNKDVGKGKYRELDNYTLRDLRTASHVFAGAVDHMVRRGMTSDEARYLDNPKDKPPPARVGQREIEFAHDLLGALAYTMYCFRISAKQVGPNVSHVPRRLITKFHKRVHRRLLAAGRKDPRYQISDLEQDIAALAALNSEITYDLLDSDASKYTTFRWHDRSLQEFYAAWWLSRYAGEKDVQRLRKWRYDDTWDDEKKSLYEPLWGFLVEMPREVRRARVWLPCVKVLFEYGVNARCCEMIYRAWPTLKRSQAGRGVIEEWQQEFRQLLRDEGPTGAVAWQIPSGLLPIEAGICPYGADPLADPPQPGVDRFVEKFQLHMWPVTNVMYEMFDPGHFAHRWGSSVPHPLAGPDGNGDDQCPVVNVTWYNAWCFAAWCGCRLPTDLEWEHAARKGSPKAWFFGDDESELKRYAHYEQEWDSGSTLPVDDGARLPNRNGLFDMAGNVWEWCEDRWEPAASARVLRGGCWFDFGRYCRSASRHGYEPDDRNLYFGFRLAAVPVVGAKTSEQASGAQATSPDGVES